MSHFLQEVVSGEKFELLIDTKIFPKEIILQASYNLLDRGYFFFRLDEQGNMILEFTMKHGIDDDPKIIIGDFSDELLDTHLRDQVEKNNKVIREAIVTKAINGPLDMQNFVSLDTDENKGNENEIDFDKDIDDILKEIENDPELKIDEDEIENILKEIEEEAEAEMSLPEIKVDPSAISNVKDMFKKK